MQYQANCKVIQYPTGLIRFKLFRGTVSVGEKDELTPVPSSLSVPEQYHPEMLFPDDEDACVDDDEHVVSPKSHFYNIKQKVFDLAISNEFEWFFTLTLSPDVCVRSDYDSCSKEIMRFTKYLGKHGGRWVFVPEYHEDGINYHFHGLCSADIEFVPAVNPHTGKPIFKKGRQIFNCPAYRGGYFTASRLEDPAKGSAYILKYMTKQAMSCVPPHRRHFWASRNLARPSCSYELLPPDQMASLVEYADYRLEVKSRSVAPDYILVEYKPKSAAPSD